MTVGYLIDRSNVMLLPGQSVKAEVRSQGIGFQAVTRKPNKTVDRCRLKNRRFEE